MVRGLLPYAVFIEYVYLHLNGCIGVNVSTYSVCVNQVKYGVNLASCDEKVCMLNMTDVYTGL